MLFRCDYAGTKIVNYYYSFFTFSVFPDSTWPLGHHTGTTCNRMGGATSAGTAAGHPAFNHAAAAAMYDFSLVDPQGRLRGHSSATSMGSTGGNHRLNPYHIPSKKLINSGMSSQQFQNDQAET